MDEGRPPFLLHDDELGPMHCLISFDFWLLFIACALGNLPSSPASLVFMHVLIIVCVLRSVAMNVACRRSSQCVISALELVDSR